MNESAIQPRMDHPFYIAARVYCDERGLEGEDQLQQVMLYLAHKAFMEESEPWRREKAKVLALYPTTTYIKTDTGQFVAVPPELPENIKEMFKEIDTLIARIAGRCGLPPVQI